MLSFIIAILCLIPDTVSIEQTVDTIDETIPVEYLDSLTSLDEVLEEESIYKPTEYDLKLIEWSLAWLDTTTCDGIADTASLPDSIYIKRLSALPREMDMTYNRVVKAQIERYMKRAPRQVAMLKRLGEYYFPIFEDALNRHGLPLELKYLPVIESALNVNAHSRMGAAGLWQFMVSTGKLCGLEVNSLVDERYDPYKSTDAACRFLKSLYSVYHDWTLVIAAYNCGPGNVNKAIHRANEKHDFWDIFEYLPRETRSYVPIFVAANYAMNRKMVFKSRTGFAESAVQYAALAAFILAGNTLMLSMLTGAFGINSLVAKIITEITFFAISWTVQRYVIFYREDSAEQETTINYGAETGREARDDQKA